MTVIRILPAAIFAPAAIQLLLALQYGDVTFAWNSAQVIGLFCSPGGTFIVFLVWEYYKGDAAMIHFSIAGKTTVWVSSLTYGLFMGQIFCASYYLPVYFQGVKGVSPTVSGVYILPSVVPHVNVIFSLASGVLRE